MQICLLGFNNVNIYASMPEDTLHQDFNGLTIYSLDCLYLELDRTLSKSAAIHAKGVIKERLQYLRQLHGTTYLRKGLIVKSSQLS